MNLLTKLKGSKPFFYEISGRLIAISRDKVAILDTTYENKYNKFKRILETQEDVIIEICSMINKVSMVAELRVNECKDNCMRLEIYLDRLTSKEKEEIEKQILELEEIKKKCRLLKSQ